MDSDKRALWRLKVANKTIRELKAENKTLRSTLDIVRKAHEKATAAWINAEDKLPPEKRTLL